MKLSKIWCDILSMYGSTNRTIDSETGPPTRRSINHRPEEKDGSSDDCKDERAAIDGIDDWKNRLMNSWVQSIKQSTSRRTERNRSCVTLRFVSQYLLYDDYKWQTFVPSFVCMSLCLSVCFLIISSYFPAETIRTAEITGPAVSALRGLTFAIRYLQNYGNNYLVQ